PRGGGGGVGRDQADRGAGEGQGRLLESPRRSDLVADGPDDVVGGEDGEEVEPRPGEGGHLVGPHVDEETQRMEERRRGGNAGLFRGQGVFLSSTESNRIARTTRGLRFPRRGGEERSPQRRSLRRALLKPSLPRAEHETPALELSGRRSGLVLLRGGAGTHYYREVGPARRGGDGAAKPAWRVSRRSERGRGKIRV